MMRASPAESSPPDVAGISLSGTEPYVIAAEENRVLCQSMGIEPEPGGEAHPIYYYIATQIGMKTTVAELCAICQFDVADGPMLANSTVRFVRPLRTGEAYRVRGHILGLTRKRSRTLGLMDILDYHLELLLPDDSVAAEVTNAWVLPRAST